MTDGGVVRCDPREQEAAIRDLFVRNGKPEFGATFERAYRTRAERGLRSWLGLADDRVIMHISVTPMPFVGTGRSLMGGVLGDLMVDEQHRDFWGPVRLLRTMVADLKRAGDIHFLFTTSNNDATGIFKAAGFKPFGTLRRYTLPLYLPYLQLARVKGRVARHRAEAHAFDAARCDELAGTADCDGRWRPRAEAGYYGTRIPRAEFADGTWIGVTRSRGQASGSALVSRCLVTPDARLADAFWNSEQVGFGEVVHAAARWARSQKYTRLAFTTLQESGVAGQLLRAGFFPREIRSELLMAQLGPVAPPSVEQWFLPDFAMSGW